MVKLRHLLSIFSLSLLLGTGALAQTNLTQIRDTVTNADGTPFNGTVVITFTGYSGSSNSSTISPLSTSARIYNGILSVLLVPSTTAGTGAFYQAAYHSNDGLTSWTETWAVPVSSTAVTLSVVRTSSNGGTSTGSSGSSSGSNTTTYATLPIAISDVSGLTSQLSSLTSSFTNLSGSVTTNTGNISSLQSTVSGMSATVTSNNSTLTALNSTVSGLNSSVSANSGSLTSLTSVVNGLIPTVNSNNGSVTSLTSVVNSMNSTVTSNNSALLGLNSTVSSLSTTVTNLQNSVASLSSSSNSSSSSSSQSIPYSFVDNETPAGAINGTNTAYTLANLPNPVQSLELYRNGLAQTVGVDYTISGSNITFLSGSIPVASDVLLAFYRMSGSSTVVTFVDGELPTGTKDGSNLAFNLVAAPSPAIDLKLYKNGMLLRQGGDYTLSGTTVTFVAAATPRTNDSLTAFYRH